MNDRNTTPTNSTLPDASSVTDVLRRFGVTVDPRRLAGGLRRLAAELLPAESPGVECEVRALLADWAGEALPDPLPASAPLAPIGALRHALLSWRPAADAWELRLVGWCTSPSAEVGAVRRQATWDLPWDELPDAARAAIIRCGKRAGSRLLVEDPDLRAEAPVPPGSKP